MNERVKRLLLEADMAELEGIGDSPVAALVREDSGAAAEAARILAALRAADRGLMSVAYSAAYTAADTAAAAAEDTASATGWQRSAAAPERGRDPAGRAARRTGGRARRDIAPALAGATALAAIATLLITGLWPAPEPAGTATEVEPLTARLAGSSPRRIAVFPTDNPDIAVVWLLEEEE